MSLEGFPGLERVSELTTVDECRECKEQCGLRHWCAKPTLDGTGDNTMSAEKCSKVGAAALHPAVEDNHFDEGMQCFERALRLARDTGDIETQCLILINPALHNWGMGKYTISQALADEVFTLGQLCGNCYMQADALHVKAICAKSLGNLTNSVSLLQTAREPLALCGMSRSVLDLRLRIIAAHVHMEKSEYTEARMIFTQVASEMSVEPEQIDFALTLVGLGQIGVATGESKQDVLQNLEMGERIFTTLEDVQGPSLHGVALAELELREGDML
ncbi:hypothetical protein C8R45DRAFT_936082 [Mycena sanguinolenta]|nr:hypothetical protein C8R45DRAFT_936082 [Mycena sanguinolenta]